jgi:hypothetical protein
MINLQDNSQDNESKKQKLESAIDRLVKIKTIKEHLAEAEGSIISQFSETFISQLLETMPEFFTEGKTIHIASHGNESVFPDRMVSLISSPSSDETAQALLDGIFASLNQADQRINSTQKSIDALAAETKTMLSQLKELV